MYVKFHLNQECLVFLDWFFSILCGVGTAWNLQWNLTALPGSPVPLHQEQVWSLCKPKVCSSHGHLPNSQTDSRHCQKKTSCLKRQWQSLQRPQYIGHTCLYPPSPWVCYSNRLYTVLQWAKAPFHFPPLENWFYNTIDKWYILGRWVHNQFPLYHGLYLMHVQSSMSQKKMLTRQRETVVYSLKKHCILHYIISQQ